MIPNVKTYFCTVEFAVGDFNWTLISPKGELILLPSLCQTSQISYQILEDIVTVLKKTYQI